MIFPQNVSPRRAAEVLHRVFDGIPGGFAFRLWDGSVVNLGGGDARVHGRRPPAPDLHPTHS